MPIIAPVPLKQKMCPTGSRAVGGRGGAPIRLAAAAPAPGGSHSPAPAQALVTAGAYDPASAAAG